MKTLLAITLLALTASAQVPIPKSVTVTNWLTVTAQIGAQSSDWAKPVQTTNATPTIEWRYDSNATFTVYSSRYESGPWRAVGTTTNKTYTVQLPTNAPSVVTVVAQVATNTAGPWWTVTNWPTLSVTNPTGAVYYRLNITRQ